MRDQTGSVCIRVMTVDDHSVVCPGLKLSLLAFDDLELVAEVESSEEALVENASLDGLTGAIHAAYAGQVTLAPEAIKALREARLQ